jgi:hypothetical protein
MINADANLIQEGLDEGYEFIDDIAAAFVELAKVLTANGVDIQNLLKQNGLNAGDVAGTAS